jgi:hypothetical protein
VASLRREACKIGETRMRAVKIAPNDKKAAQGGL